MCSDITNFFATDGFYAGTLHFLTAIEIPLHTFGAFMIICKTPEKMRHVKWILLLLHFVGALLDIFLSCLTTPVVNFPMISGYPLGLAVPLGLPINVLAYIGISMVGTLAVTILVVFEDRHYQIINALFGRKRSWYRLLYIIVLYFISATFLAPAYLKIPNENLAKLVIKNKIPCITDDVLQRPGYFIISTTNTTFCLCLLFMLSIFATQLFYFVFSIFNHFSHTVAKSRATARQQRKFVIAMCIQVFIPVVVVIIPVVYIICANFFDYYSQAGNNLAMAAIVTHGVLTTFTMLIVHSPYRKATLEMFYCSTNY
ncbi:Serpentine Receptor, class H [Caenorhabditis elegans]|uniref:Serpentine Receptor, class H n=1 Tax=Caenorhabditis elegans TaxID=6239 RepID=O17986_CAEEL|nr:Serpentine Receptor, class H [Caenorhabditis elegans]CAB04629.2 Serpentine Receptor, class H [Caenorhabditis elegans]|eukprot:NP_506823.2 Serpentine Receptor, class H [Caenorhabditis elegans]